jgi:hypothetical protein
MATFAEVPISLPRNPTLFDGNRLDGNAGSLKKTVKLALRHSVAAIIDHQSSFKVTGHRHPPVADILDCLGKYRRVSFVQEYRQDSRRVDNHAA